MYLLDTNACIGFLNGKGNVIRAFQARDPKDLYLCSIVKAELLYGAWASKRVVENLRKLEPFFEPLTSLPFDDACANYLGQLRAELKGRGQPIGGNDLMIAAIALANNLIVVTHNQKEFSKVNGLRLEDWEI
jgi:tRNA(fMet)-specific endonuclease VapC